MDPKKQNKNQKSIRNQNVLEALKTIGSGTSQSFKKDLLQGASADMFKQLFGMELPKRKISGDLMPGESLEMDKAYSGEQENLVKERRSLSFLNQLKENEVRSIKEQSGVLKMKLNELQNEVVALASTTHGLAEETKQAVTQQTIEPGIYHIHYVERIIQFIKSFRKNITPAETWMHATNKKAQKKGFWNKYKEHGSKFLLSADHYLTRSAG